MKFLTFKFIVIFIYVDDYYGPEFECLIQAEDETQCTKENNFEYEND